MLGLVALLACAAEPNWTAVLRADDIVAGEALQTLKTRRRWAWQFENGKFEVAVRKSAIPLPSSDCRMEYLVLAMPVYYPENPAQAPMAERRAVYDALLRMQKEAKGSLRVVFDALWYTRNGPAGPRLTTCNIYFKLPLPGDAAKVLP